MALFSERYGYVQPRTVLIRESMPPQIANGICTAFDLLYSWLSQYDSRRGLSSDYTYTKLEESLWVSFLYKRLNDFYHYPQNEVVATKYILSNVNEWYKKLDLIEKSIKIMRGLFKDMESRQIFERFKDTLNRTFQGLGYAYRVVNDEIVEITSEAEIVEIENALTAGDTIANHINTSLSLLSQRPEGDYRNSIKESISAVEVICRELTGASTLGDALKEFKKKGFDMPSNLEEAFKKLYAYTNDKTTGIRHALLDDTYEPGFDEAKFMLVACSAFVNYLKAKTA